MREALSIRGLEELRLSGLLPERLAVVCVCVCECVCARACAHVGWCIVVAAALAGIASSLHSGRRSGGEWGKKKRVEIDWHMLHPGYYFQSFFFFWTGVFLQREVCAVQRKYSTGSGISRKHSRVKWTWKMHSALQVCMDRGEHQYLCCASSRWNGAALSDGVPVDRHHVEYSPEEASAVRTQGTAAKTRKWLLLADLAVCVFSPGPHVFEPVSVHSWASRCAVVAAASSPLWWRD